MPAMNGDAFFSRDGNWYVGHDAARGPWDPNGCHAGPVTGALAGEAERLFPKRQLTRLTVTYLRPAPMDGFRVESESLGGGRAAASGRLSLWDRHGRLCARADSLHLARTILKPLPTAQQPAPNFSESEAATFPLRSAWHGQDFFGSRAEVRLSKTQPEGPGPKVLWMKCRPIVDGEALTPFQRICPLADCANGFARNADDGTRTFINPDITVLMHRPAMGDWMASDGISFWEPSGIGATHATLFDTRGVVATALQSLVIRDR
ncbi:MAG: thioesterase family protein [Pseudomonadota bacterium]